jgi:hypothetical protein
MVRKFEEKNADNSCLAPTLQSCYEKTIKLKENNLNFGEPIYLKSRADRQAANRYMQARSTYPKI